MPCFHFTFHAYGTWLPDKEKGYVHRQEGVKPRDEPMASRYRANQKHPSVNFTPEQQEAIAATLRVAGKHLDATLHCYAIDPTHLHILLSWKHEQSHASIRTSIKTSITRRLNKKFGQRTWLVKGSSRKQVNDHDHFCYLIREYLPSHHGLFWLREEERERYG